jgi:multidrug efflux pump subunit AcrA (membrane-fusion protein)
MRKKRWPIVLGVVVALVAGAAVFVAPALTPKPQYETYTVESTEVIKTVSANGQLAETQLLAYGPAVEPVQVGSNGAVTGVAQFGVSLEVREIFVELGQKVEAGYALYTYRDQLGREIDVEAISDGVVRSIDTTVGLRTAGSVLTIGTDQPIVSVFVSEYDADLVSLGQVATVELDAINASFNGEVLRIGQVAQSVSGIKQYEVLLEVRELPGGARFGMSATAEIEVEKKTEILAVPLSALVGEDEAQVDILIEDADGNQTVSRKIIELGLIGDSFAEVLSGLGEGDLVVTGVSGSIPAPVNFGPPPGARQGG